MPERPAVPSIPHTAPSFLWILEYHLQLLCSGPARYTAHSPHKLCGSGHTKVHRTVSFVPCSLTKALPLRPPQGPRALYKGFVPKALRLGIGQTIGLMVFQESMALMGAKEGQ